MKGARDFESSNSVTTSCSASGKVLLAHRRERDAVLAGYEKHGLMRSTSRRCGSARTGVGTGGGSAERTFLRVSRSDAQLRQCRVSDPRQERHIPQFRASVLRMGVAGCV